MAKNENEGKGPPEPDQPNSGSPADETIRFDSVSDSDNDVVGDSTLIPKDDAAASSEAVPAEADATDDPTDPGATLTLESTVQIDPKSSEITKQIDADEPAIAGVAFDLTVVSDSVNESTDDAESGPASSNAAVVSRGKGDPRLTAGRLQDETQADLDAGGDASAIPLGGSIMSSSQIDATINPRELSDKDAALWNTAVSSGDVSSLPPAINRTFSDKHFDRLRTCDVAPLKSDPQVSSDYRLVRKLGQGGMGDVYVARQGSLDRLLALKVLKPLAAKRRDQLVGTGKLTAVDEERRRQFLSEAIVTGDLEHPNIVPIHDVALSSSGQLFYSMKRVVGTPWSAVIKDNTRDENLEILLKVADAVGFAHTRGVVHRDIKPENIMLGDFGVVLVMDWGLALPTSGYSKQDSVPASSGLGGTPAFMAPEMAIGPLEKIGPASDIYLLGATLYMVITGYAPHRAKNITECLKAVRGNEIREVPEDKRGELLDIAMRAMASKPEDRFPDVESFQKAIRDYRSHAESILLATRATEDLQRAKRNRSYSDFSRATFGFEEAIEFWHGNQKAHRGLAESKLQYAEAAYENGDYDLGLSLLDEHNPDHAETIGKLREGLRERASHVFRSSLFRKVAAALLAFIIVGGSVAIFVINQKRSEAQKARDNTQLALEGQRLATNLALAAKRQEELEKNKALRAEQDARDAEREARIAEQDALDSRNKALQAKAEEERARADAEAAEKVARVQEQKARDAERAAEAAKQEEASARALADTARQRAEYEEYVAKIGLAKARLERNEADGARDILKELQRSPRASGWEWRWLWQQVNQSQSDSRAEAPVMDLSISPSGRRGVIALSDGKVQRLTFAADGRITERYPIENQRLQGFQATAVAFAPHQDVVAVGTRTGHILVVTDDQLHVLKRSHTDRVSDLQFTSDGLLVSGSLDRTARLWNIDTQEELTKQNACWHLLPVRQLAVSGTAESITLAVATADDSTGNVAIWNLKTAGKLSAEQIGTFTDHRYPVSSIALTEDGQLAASGDIDGNVLMWSPQADRSIDYAAAINDALEKLDGNVAAEATVERQRSPLRIARLVDPTTQTQRQFVSTTASQRSKSLAHIDIVKSVRFSTDGKWLVTGSDDYTLKLWDVSTRQLNRTLKGHGGWVVGGELMAGKPDVIISASNDATVRTWQPRTYTGAFVSQSVVDEKEDSRARDTRAHTSVISSARFSHDGTKVVTASGDHTARVMAIDTETLAFRQIARLEDEQLDEGTSFVAMSMEVDRRGGRLYVGSADATVRIWDLRRGVEIGQAPRTGLNDAFAVSTDGKWMLTGSSSPKIKAILWRLDPTGKTSPRLVHPLEGHDQSVTAFAISPDSKMLFTGDRGGYGIIWDAATGQRLGPPVEAVRGSRINAARFSSDGRELLIAADDEQLTRIDVLSRRRISRMNHEGFVTQLSLSSDGRSALTLSELLTETMLQTTATLWDLGSSEGRVLDQVSQRLDPEKASGVRKRSRITSVRFDETGQVAVVSRSATDQHGTIVKVWSLAPGTSRLDRTVPLEGPKQTLELPAKLGTSEVVVPLDAGSLLTMNNDGAFRWDLVTNKLVKSYQSHAELTEASFSSDGTVVATASRSVKLWDVATGNAIAKLESPHLGPVRSVAFAPTPQADSTELFATGGDDGVVRTWSWNPTTDQVDKVGEYTTTGPSRRINRVCFSRQGDRLLAVGSVGTAVVWTLDRSLPPIMLGVSDAGDFLCGAFSRDDKCVAVGGSDHKVRVWSFPSGGQLAPPVVLKGHADRVNDVVLFGNRGDQLRVFTASADGSVRVWDPRFDATGTATSVEGRELVQLRRHETDVTAVDLFDGQLLMTAGSDGTVVLWPAAPNSCLTCCNARQIPDTDTHVR